MSEPVKISSLEIEAVKRVNAVSLEPTQNGLTVIGGGNNQGKTSVIDAIAWALGGDRMRPDDPKNADSVRDPFMKVELSNGIVVERKGKNSSLKVTDPQGIKAGQNLLNSFVEAFALDLPKFMEGSDKDKADALLEVIGVKDELQAFDVKIEQLYNKRQAIGQMERQKRGAAEEMPNYPEAPAEPISASELIQEQQAILAKNGENQRIREQAASLNADLVIAEQEAQTLSERVAMLTEQLTQKNQEIEDLRSKSAVATKSAEELRDESTAEIEAKLQAIEATNEMVRTNAAKLRAEGEADELKDQYDALTDQVEAERAARLALLNGANLPLPGLSVEDGRLTYQGHTWGDMSGSEQLKVATAIVRAIKPECGFVLVDKLEQMDLNTLREFGSWAEAEGLQIIGTRVSDGEECSIVIHDGYAIEPAGTKGFEGEVSASSDQKWVM